MELIRKLIKNGHSAQITLPKFWVQEFARSGKVRLIVSNQSQEIVIKGEGG